MNDDLDFDLVGRALVAWAAVTTRLGHADPRDTDRYVHLGERATDEQRFVRAVICGDDLGPWEHLLAPWAAFLAEQSMRLGRDALAEQAMLRGGDA